jgi:hypothetical protein
MTNLEVKSPILQQYEVDPTGQPRAQRLVRLTAAKSLPEPENVGFLQIQGCFAVFRNRTAEYRVLQL